MSSSAEKAALAADKAEQEEAKATGVSAAEREAERARVRELKRVRGEEYRRRNQQRREAGEEEEEEEEGEQPPPGLSVS